MSVLRVTMMRFKALLLNVAFSAGCALATHPADIFIEHQNAILAQEVTCVEGYVFGVARVVLENTKDLLLVSMMGAQAEFDAKTNFLEQIHLSEIAWPESLTPSDCAALRQILMMDLSVSATVQGVQTVFSKQEGNVWVAVVALPEREVAKIPKLTFVQAKAKLLNPDLVFFPGVDISVLLTFRRACGESLPNEVDRAPWEDLLRRATFPGARLSALPRFAGRFPVGCAQKVVSADFAAGMNAFKSGDVTSAYEAFLRAAEQTLPFDALNMAGNCARRIGKRPEAVALLLHAAYLKPESPYPWIHLAYVALAEGEKALCEQCCVAAEQRSPDTWTLQQLDALRKTMLPSPTSPTPEPVVTAPKVAPTPSPTLEGNRSLHQHVIDVPFF